VATQSWNIGVVGPRITSGPFSGDTKALVVFEASVVSNGAWHTVGLNVTSYGQDMFYSYFPYCYI